MYIIVIAWMYVAVMMTVAEATHDQGTILGAVFTFLLYGVLPVTLLVYLMGRGARRRAREEREALEESEAQQRPAAVAAQAGASGEPDAGGEASAGTVAPVRKEP
jgi:Na+-transporting methylmalonyl-CoA/oxaloacetate decarboxylase gamma subunit